MAKKAVILIIILQTTKETLFVFWKFENKSLFWKQKIKIKNNIYKSFDVCPIPNINSKMPKSPPPIIAPQKACVTRVNNNNKIKS